MNSLTMLYIEEQYTKIKLLKQSAKSEVWLVTDESGNLYVLKVINHVGIPGRLLKETVSQIIYFAEDKENKLSFFIEEFLTGKTLEQHLKNGKIFTEKEAADFLKSLCVFLQKLHKAGIIHRDIKPSNIILQDNKPVLIDYDIARIVTDKLQTEDTMLLGTKGYAPPEQFGYSQTDIRSDIYSLGMTLKEMLPLEYKGYLRKIEKKCHALDPDMRYQSVQEILQAMTFARYTKYSIWGIMGLLMCGVMIFYYSPDKIVTEPEKELTVQDEKAADNTANLNAEKVILTQDVNNNTTAENKPQAVAAGIQENKPPENIKKDADKLNLVQMQAFVNGEALDAVNNYFISSDSFRYWQRASSDELTGDYACVFPDGWYAECVFSNDTDKVWHKPHITITYKSTAHSEAETVDLPDLAPGASSAVRFDLSGRIHDSASSYSATVDFRPDWPEGIVPARAASVVTLYFRQDNGYHVWDELKNK